MNLSVNKVLLNVPNHELQSVFLEQFEIDSFSPCLHADTLLHLLVCMKPERTAYCIACGKYYNT